MRLRRSGSPIPTRGKLGQNRPVNVIELAADGIEPVACRRHRADLAGVERPQPVEGAHQPIRESTWVARHYENSCPVIHDLGNATGGRRDDRQPGRHRLDENARQVVPITGENEQIGSLHRFCDSLFRDTTSEPNSFSNSQFTGQLLVYASGCSVTDQLELPVVSRLQLRECVKQDWNSLYMEPVEEPNEEQLLHLTIGSARGRMKKPKIDGVGYDTEPSRNPVRFNCVLEVTANRKDQLSESKSDFCLCAIGAAEEPPRKPRELLRNDHWDSADPTDQHSRDTCGEDVGVDEVRAEALPRDALIARKRSGEVGRERYARNRNLPAASTNRGNSGRERVVGLILHAPETAFVDRNGWSVEDADVVVNCGCPRVLTNEHAGDRVRRAWVPGSNEEDLHF